VTYQKGLSNKQIADIFSNLEKCLVKADSAEPKSIDEIYSYGVNIMACTKGRDSVTQGIQYVQDQKISMTKRSVNLIKEYRNYMWQTDKDGRILNVPMDAFNHALDAGRYGHQDLKGPKKEGVLVTFSGGDPVTKYGSSGTSTVDTSARGYQRKRPTIRSYN